MRTLTRWTILAAVFANLGGCSYLGTVALQADYSVRQLASPQQRLYKHLLSRETSFVFGRIEPGQTRIDVAVPMAVIAVSDRFRDGEVVDINQLVRSDSYYGMNLPEGDYRLLVVGDLDGDGYYEANEILGMRPLSLNLDVAPDKVVGGYDIVLSGAGGQTQDAFRIAVTKAADRVESVFYPKGTLRTFDDPIFSPDMASLGLFQPAVFLERAPMMFYALDEDLGYKIPVVFVHGIGGSVRDFEHIVARLDRRRYKPWFFYYPSGMDLSQLGAMFYKLFLAGKVIPLGEMPIIVVAHSMGGMVVREALNLQTGSGEEARVGPLITISSPMGGHPAAKNAALAPVVIPSWRDIDPASAFISRLHRRALSDRVDYHLFYTRGTGAANAPSGDGDGVVPLSSQLDPAARQEAKALYGFADTHTGVLDDPAAIDTIISIIDTVQSPFPDSFVRVLQRGGYPVELGTRYSPMEAYFIHNIGFFMEAMASGQLVPFHPSQEHFVKVAHGEASPENAVETAWVKFVGDYPDRSIFPAPEEMLNTATERQ